MSARGDPGRLRDARGRERPDRVAHGVEPVGERGQPAGPHQPLVEQRVQDGEQQERVGARAGSGRCQSARAAVSVRRGSIDDQPAAAGLHRLQPPLDAGRGHQAAVRGQRVRAQHQEVVGAVDVGHRHQELVAEHGERGEHVGELVHRRRRVAAAAAQRAVQHLGLQQRAVVVHVRVAQVDGDGVAAVPLLDVDQARARPRRAPRPSRSPSSPRPPGAGAAGGGRGRRGGRPRATALGQMWPRLKGSSRVAADGADGAAVAFRPRSRTWPRTASRCGSALRRGPPEAIPAILRLLVRSAHGLQD